ncbi:chymotrypsin protease C1 [Danaus plexippus plexippus]|uniref:Chymotrypsin protease C1 n=1 Tax=Danaus plexippus plexippus TaxID=278856 RepID=A0A212F7H4_DANPL|nr:trypsin-4-like [Danaus plexippus plexippus]OWR49694.1 chymotrypsin protease C1 [Danaus plexippus plexippus]
MFQAGCWFISLLVGSIGLPLSGGYTSGYFGDIKARVINGYEANLVPHMVALTVGEDSKILVCGASLITKRHVLTAAHCIDAFIDKGKLSRSLKGIVGTNDWNKGGTHYTFSGNITHPEWDAKNVNNDIGILITSQPVTLNKYVQIITLNFQFIGGNVAAIINGWGQFEKGDSGSPLILRDNRQQIGVVSWGVNPSASGYPDVYGRISAYKSWIKQSVRLRIRVN